MRTDDDPQVHPPPLYLTGLLAAVLFVPYGINFISIEPFPAVILPAGEGRVEVGDDMVVIKQIAIQAKRPSSEEFVDIPAEQFLAPAPTHYLHSIARNQFGLEPHMSRRIRGRKGLIQFDFTPIGARDDSRTEAARLWYAQRLAELGFDDTCFYLATIEREYSKTSNASELKVIERKAYELR